MKCPSEEQLMLFAENELTENERISIKAHLGSCQQCHQIVADFDSDFAVESLIREKINLAFEKHKSEKRIMKLIEAEPVHKTSKHSIGSVLNNLFVRFLVPALAVAIALFVFLSGNDKSINKQNLYTGTTYKVSVFTNNTDSFVDEKEVAAGNSFILDADKLTKLNGNFLVNVVSNGKSYSMNVDGNTSIKFDAKQMMLNFDDCKADITMVNGSTTKIYVENNLFSVSLKNPYFAKKIESMDSINSSEINETDNVEYKETVKVVNEPKKEEEKVVTTIDVIDSSQIENEEKEECEAAFIQEELEEINEEPLTTDVTNGIVILNRKSNDDNQSPFGE